MPQSPYQGGKDRELPKVPLKPGKITRYLLFSYRSGSPICGASAAEIVPENATARLEHTTDLRRDVIGSPLIQHGSHYRTEQHEVEHPARKRESGRGHALKIDLRVQGATNSNPIRRCVDAVKVGPRRAPSGKPLEVGAVTAPDIEDDAPLERKNPVLFQKVAHHPKPLLEHHPLAVIERAGSRRSHRTCLA